MNLTYGIIANMALEFRLSLANLCKILGNIQRNDRCWVQDQYGCGGRKPEQTNYWSNVIILLFYISTRQIRKRG